MGVKLGKQKRKTWLWLVLILMLTAAALGIFLAARSGGEPVSVFPFQYVGMTEYWGDNQESYGPVRTDKIQTIFLSDTQSVTEIKVSLGDTVKKGDVLMTFDTSLDALALERKRLEVEKLKLDLDSTKHELEDVRAMEPYEPTEYEEPEPTEPDYGTKLKDKYKIHLTIEHDGTAEEKAVILWLQDDENITNDILVKLWKEIVGEDPEPEPTETETTETETTESETTESETTETETTESETTETETTETETTETETTETETTESETTETETTEATTTETTETEKPAALSEEETGETENDSGEGTMETSSGNPQPSSASGLPVLIQLRPKQVFVVFKITEDNMSKGARLFWQGVRITKDQEGHFSFRFFDASAMEDYTLPKEEETPIEIPQIDFGSGYTVQQLAQMRSQLAKQIKEQEFNVRMAEAEYKLMQIEISDGNVYAELDGEIVSLLTEEEARMQRQPLIKLSGGGGFFVEGSVNELEKDKLQPGQEVTINDWNTGNTYTGEVREIGDFPSSDDGWNGMGNPNATYYPFTVFISGEADLQAGSYVSVMYSTVGTENGVYLENAFLREEQGASYVMVRGADGKLEKRTVTVGKSLWGSYQEILSGITEEDFIAFPYGKDVKIGAATVESDLSALYGY